MKTLDYTTYRDRILGGWIGKSLGGIVGAPFECHKHFHRMDKEHLWPTQLYPNDDLDIQVVWLEALQELGVNPSSRQLAQYWKEHCFYTCCEYGVFIDNLDHGIYPPLTGTWNNAFFEASEGCPIRSEIWGFISPGNPHLAMDYAAKDGCLDHGRTSIELEQFLSAAASLAFFCNDPVELFEKSCQCVPADNTGVRLYQGVKRLCETYQDEYELWMQIIRTYGSCDGTKALINNAFAMMALFRGGNDFKEIMRLCVQIGWDVDCSCATAGALWGALHGSQSFPQEWLDKMGKTLICACEIPHRRALLTDFADETAAIGLEVAAQLNPEIIIQNAPAVAVRALIPAALHLEYHYENDTPVLCAHTHTRLLIRIVNPQAMPQKCRLDISAPPCADVKYCHELMEVPAKGSMEVPIEIWRRKEASWLPRVILFDVTLHTDDGKLLLQDRFGVQGASQWQVYGPYWDMWDKDAVPVCPYENDQLTCNPGNLPEYGCDATACHIRPREEYLDKDALLQHELPDELPYPFESQTGTITREDLYAFNGASCCYLTRIICSDTPMDGVILGVSANCPYECYLDGKLLRSADDYRTARYGASPAIALTGQPQRIVVKLASTRPDFSLTLNFYKYSEDRQSAHSPYVQNISDLIR